MGLFSFRKQSLIINKPEGPEEAFVTSTQAFSVCPAALTFPAGRESVPKGERAGSP